MGKYKHMDSYRQFVNSLGISFEWRINKDTKKLEYRDLTGPEKLKLFQSINIIDLLPNYEHNKNLQEVWAG